MNEKDVRNNLGYCGKACALYADAWFCKGCKSNDPTLARHMQKTGCYQQHCCKEKGIAGCWDCDDAPCDKDVFALDEPAVYRAAIRCAKYGGPMELAGKIFLNQIHGICYPLAYFGCEDEQEARRLLDTYEEEVTEKVNNN